MKQKCDKGDNTVQCILQTSFKYMHVLKAGQNILTSTTKQYIFLKMNHITFPVVVKYIKKVQHNGVKSFLKEYSYFFLCPFMRNFLNFHAQLYHTGMFRRNWLLFVQGQCSCITRLPDESNPYLQCSQSHTSYSTPRRVYYLKAT